jgi:putative ABC transport system permease protein
MDSIIKNIRYAIRGLYRRPGFSLIAIITLALGIGANTAIFSVVNAVLLKALPFRTPERLVAVDKSADAEGLPGLAAREYIAWSERNKTFENLAAFSNDNYNFVGQGEPERILCAKVTASMFPLLGVQPVAGRTFLPEEDQPGGNPAVVVSEGFWKRRFSNKPSLVGSSIQLNDKSYTIVGVMPKNFRFPGEYEIWMPLALDRQREFYGDFFSMVQVVGRLKDGSSPEAARSELGLISRQTSELGQGEKLPVSTVDVLPLHKNLAAGFRLAVLVLWAAVGLVLLIACANVAALTLSRTLARQKEMAVRSAVGGRPRQLLSQLLTESLVLGVTGGALGILIAFWGIKAITAIIPRSFVATVYDLSAIRLDGRVLLFTLTISLLTGVIFGLAPAITSSRPDLVKTLREVAAVNPLNFGLKSLRGWLVVGEISIAVILLLAAGLLTRSFSQLLSVDTGFDAQNVLSARIDLPRSVYAKPNQTTQFYNELVQKISATPGVQSVGAINHSPLAGFGIIAFTEIEGNQPMDRKQDNPLGIGMVTQDYFRSLKIPLISGREFNSTDTADSQKIALVNQAFAKRYFAGSEVIGKRVGFGCKDNLCRTIVGVVGDIKQESLIDSVSPELYVPASQMPMNGMTLFVRTNSDPSALVATLRNQVLSIDRNQPIHRVQTLEQRIAETVADTRALMLLFGVFAGLALILATIGIYGIVSYSVSQRTHEIGIRMALGAGTQDVLKLVMKNGLTLTVAGLVIGVGGAFALTRFLRTLLFGVTPTDKLTFLIVSVCLLIIALLACLVPARRATEVNPLVALRWE